MSMVSDFPVANRREARKLGLLRSKSSEVERERLEPLERNERVCGEESGTDAHSMENPGLKPSTFHFSPFTILVEGAIPQVGTGYEPQ